MEFLNIFLDQANFQFGHESPHTENVKVFVTIEAPFELDRAIDVDRPKNVAIVSDERRIRTPGCILGKPR